MVLFGAGGGLTEVLPSGSGILEVGPNPLRGSTAVWIDGLRAEVLYAGQAPGMVSGMMQINARVPVDAGPGDRVPVTVRIGNGFSQPGVTMAIR